MANNHNLTDTTFDKCPNHDEGYTDLALPKHGGPDVTDSNWHYTGRCNGSKPHGQSVCDACAKARSKNHRLLTVKEKAYVQIKYPGTWAGRF